MADQQTRSARFFDGMIWGAGLITSTLIVGGALKWAWNAATKKDDTDELDELEEEDDNP